MSKTEYVEAPEMAHVLRLLTYENELVMRVAIHTGLRVGDVVRLRAPVKRQFWITEQKTQKKRRVNLTQDLVDALNANVNANAGKSGFCFPHRLDPSRHRTRQAVWADIRRASKALRMPQNVGTHTARKMYAVEQLQAKGDLKAVQKLLNHDDASVTALYALSDYAYRAKYTRGDGGRTTRRKR